MKHHADSANAPVLVGITGASGSIYALKLIELLKEAGEETHLVISEAGEKVAAHELGQRGLETITELADHLYGIREIWAPPASGSTCWKAMFIVPCTMGTLGSVARGISANLIHRAADCFLKERRRVVLVVRETPLNRIHIENMLAAHKAGAVIFPAMPAFYNHPGDIEEMAAMLAARVAEQGGIDVNMEGKRWQGRISNK
jgi:4-hydroxy-3-polyprenylbenzoate decarboxylase